MAGKAGDVHGKAGEDQGKGARQTANVTVRELGPRVCQASAEVSPPRPLVARGSRVARVISGRHPS